MKKPSECCTDVECESNCRNNYFDGKRLTTDSFRVEQRYLLQRRRLLNRVHGSGVVSGFAVSAAPGRLTIGPGFALDECGRELLQTDTRTLTIDDLIVDQSAQSGPAQSYVKTSQGVPAPQVCWLLSAHYAEQASGPVTVKDACSCEREEWERTCETVRYSVKAIDCSDCCSADECELTCDCGTGECCADDHSDAATYHPHKRGGCRCLCDHVTNLPGVDDCCALTEVDEACGRVRVDLRHGVPLACVQLIADGKGQWNLGTDVDACGPRRLVRRNDLLFDLIQGCDLTRISDYGWKEWHRGSVDFDAFSKALGPDDGTPHDQYITDQFWVEFSRPVRKNTVRADCFAITAMTMEREGGWWQVFRAPVVGVDFKKFPPQADDPPDCVRGATVVVDGSWVEDGVRGRRSIFLGSDTYVEIEVRGDFIVDCNGQTVDANAAGLIKTPTGNGTPGDTFLSTFTVAAAPNANAKGGAQ